MMRAFLNSSRRSEKQSAGNFAAVKNGLHSFFRNDVSGTFDSPIGGFPTSSETKAPEHDAIRRDSLTTGTRFIRTIQETMLKANETQKAALVASPGSQRISSFWVSEASYIINYSSSQMIWWTFAIFFLTIFTAVVTPVEIAFLETQLNGLFYFNRFMDFLFLTDIFFNFNLSYQDPETGMLVKERSKITKNYLAFWFWMDLISMVPYDLIGFLWQNANSTDSAGALKNVKLLRIIRLFRLMKLLRIFRAGRLFQTYQMDFAINYNTFALVKFLVTITFIIHLMTCGLVFLEEIYEYEYTWQDENGIRGFSTADRYVWAMYWSTMTVSTIGYGDVSLTTQPERIYASVCMMIGATAYAFIVGQLCNLIVNLDKEGVTFRNQLSDLNRFMANQGLPQTLQVQVRHFFGHTKSNREAREQAKNLEALSPGLRALVLISMNQHWMLKIPFFRKHIHGDFVSALSKKVEICCFAPKERIVMKHQHITKMFVVERGMVIYRSSPRFHNDFFGEEIICQASMRYVEDAIAFQYASVKVLRRKDLTSVLMRFKPIQADVKKYAVKLRFRHVGAEVITHTMAKNRGLDPKAIVRHLSMKRLGLAAVTTRGAAFLTAMSEDAGEGLSVSKAFRPDHLEISQHSEKGKHHRNRRLSFFDPSRNAETEQLIEHAKQEMDEIGKASSIEDLDNKLDAIQLELSADFDSKIRLLEKELGAQIENSFQSFLKDIGRLLDERIKG